MILFCLILSSILYSGLMIALFIGEQKIYHDYDSNETPTLSLTPFISVLISARNEEENISNILHDLSIQNYPASCFEVIIIDDNSSDETFNIATNFFYNSIISGKVLHAPPVIKNGSPKKEAIKYGITHASGEIIITTDADCRVGSHWISTLNTFYHKSKAKFISAPVLFSHKKSLFEKMQTLDFCSLIAAGAGAIGLNQPLMCNGANMTFSKEAFLHTGGYNDNINYASGDDIFLMTNIHKQYGNKSIAFLPSLEATVYTEPKKTIGEFIQQRIRWASKSKGYKTPFSLFTSLTVFSLNLFLLVSTVLCFFAPDYILPTTICWCIKLSTDLLVLFPFVLFARKKELFLLYIPTQIFVLLYTILVGFLGLFGCFSWKERVYQN